MVESLAIFLDIKGHYVILGEKAQFYNTNKYTITYLISDNSRKL
jgi:hypothetical protein